MEKMIQQICESVTNHFMDWIITAIITYFTVRIATHQYYDSTKRQVSKGIMELGLRALLSLNHNEEIPDYAQIIFVKYSGRCLNPFKAKDHKCTFFCRIRRTIEVVGGNRNEVSDYKQLNYGVLGVANQIRTPVLYDFKRQELYQYRKGNIIRINVFRKNNGVYCKVGNKEKELCDLDTDRDVMIALPLISNRKLVGGITFDLRPGDKTLYQKYNQDDSDEEKTQKDLINIKVFKEAIRTANILANAYFKKKGEEFE